MTELTESFPGEPPLSPPALDSGGRPVPIKILDGNPPTVDDPARFIDYTS